MQVNATSLPEISKLHQFREPRDFLDCYRVKSNMPVRQAAECITDFPGWAKGLLVIRRIITAPFGLHNDAPSEGDKIGIFPVETQTESEIIAGFDDKHLNFRVSVLAHEGAINLATWVAPHNIWGRAYLTAIMPFHIAISRNALKRVARG